MSVTLLATYTVLVPGIIKVYEKRLDKERQKLETVITRIELHQEMLDRAVRQLAKMQELGNDNNKMLRELKDATRNSPITSKKDR